MPTLEKIEVSAAYTAVVTFEYDRGEPECWRGTLIDSDAEDAARRAVFRASTGLSRKSWHSVVIVLSRL